MGTSPLPLAAASQRLRGRPGRPRKAPVGHDAGRPEVGASPNSSPDGRALAQQASAPRLLDLRATAAYLGVSEWTVRDLDAAGVLRRVRVPLPNGAELRKLLFDRADLDRLIEAWKDSGP
ncbi:MAG: helix-turn-helix domain-containing protein [Anaerolineae bacterium]